LLWAADASIETEETAVPLDRALIDILACPKCKGALQLRPDESAFLCPACKLVYPVTDGIPNFIVEEAKPLT
jgi:uncharacterized protein YbaR (Trm112 family)